MLIWVGDIFIGRPDEFREYLGLCAMLPNQQLKLEDLENIYLHKDDTKNDKS